MPRELPGLYWDEEKQRYFPLSSTQRSRIATASTSHLPTKPPPNATGDSHNINVKRHKIRSLLRANEDARSSLRAAHKNKLMHQISCSQVAQTSHVTSSSILSHTHCAITAFQVRSLSSTFLHSYS
ncbi:hypothetical protein DFH29DRAFT_912536 [Suillus ampliporus]|nr:hypothetical protein DFH29DRAFT_912536 [Suillus ampliporus]